MCRFYIGDLAATCHLMKQNGGLLTSTTGPPILPVVLYLFIYLYIYLFIYLFIYFLFIAACVAESFLCAAVPSAMCSIGAIRDACCISCA